jgi:hypothetical protein
MNTMGKYRYPGPRPFADNDQELFFGRKTEEKLLINLIKNNRLNVLFGRSGNGKSSLIHAALIPYFNTERFKIIEIRVQPFRHSESGKDSLNDQIIEEIKKNKISEKIFLNEILPEDDQTSLWQYVKTLQWDYNQEGCEGIVFIIDQFEEFFNFPAEEYKIFAKEFSEIVYNRVPYKFQETLNEKIRSGDDFINQNKYKVDFIKNDFFSSYLIGVRSDRLYLLDGLGDMIPFIFNNRFRLDNLNLDKVDDAIKKPAGIEGQFASPIFEISEEIVTAIKEYLFDKNSTVRQNYFETFQLQIICRYIEKRVIQIDEEERKKNDGRSEPKKIVITKDNLSKEIKDIIKEYYEDVILNINLDKDPNLNYVNQLLVRFLIEKKLIDVKTNSRICLDKTSIYPLGIHEELLSKLTESKIIRKEINTVSGESFEISHDSLLNPILLASDSGKLGNLDIKLYKYYATEFDAIERHLRKDFKKEVLPRIINKEGNLESFKLDDFSERLQLPIEELKAKHIITEKPDNNKNGYHIINEAFRNVIIKKQNEDAAKKQNVTKLTLFALISISFICILGLIDYRYQHDRDTKQHKIDFYRIFLYKNKLLFNPYLGNTADTAKLVKRLILLSKLYKNIRSDTSAVKDADAYLISLFNSYDFLGKRLSMPDLYPYSQPIINKNGELLAIYTDQKPINGISTDTVQQGKPQIIHRSVCLYNNNGKSIGWYKGIFDAAFGPSSELVVLKKDSLFINLQKPVKVKLNFHNINSQKINNIAISYIKNGFIFCIISLPDSSKTSNGNSSPSFSLNNPYISNAAPIKTVYAKIGYSGNVSQVSGSRVFDTGPISNTSNGYQHQIYKNMALSIEGEKVSIKWDKYKKTEFLDEVISDAKFSPKGDTIFVTGQNSLFILDKYLNKLSKFRNDALSQNGISKFAGIVVYNQTYYFVLVNVNDPIIKMVNTLEPNSIISYIDWKITTHAWQNLTKSEKTGFGFTAP